MSKITICDRCGEVIKSTPISYIILYKGKLVSDKSYDLCPECIATLTQWLETGRLKSEN